MVNSVVLEGYYARVDSFGRLYWDKCASDEEHLLTETPEGAERPGCRVYVSDLLPKTEGKRTWLVEISCLAQQED